MSLNKVTNLEIEIFSKCNRKCSWCPNSVIDRFSESINMEEKTYLNFLEEINNKIKDKSKLKISYSRYNEPFFDIELLRKRVKQARNIFPNIILEANTNGDYLRKKGSEVLEDLPLDYINIMDYDCKGLQHGRDLFKKCDIKTIYDPEDVKDTTRWGKHTLIGKRKNIKKIDYIANWPKIKSIQDRGGFFREKNTFKKVISNYGNKGKKVKFKNQNNVIPKPGILTDNRRKEPCNYPTIGIYVDYNGSVTPCCHIRSDVSKHKDYILGNINNDSITNIFNSKKAKEFRNLLNSNNWEEYPDPCKFCAKTSLK